MVISGSALSFSFLVGRAELCGRGVGVICGYLWLAVHLVLAFLGVGCVWRVFEAVTGVQVVWGFLFCFVELLNWFFA